jgi:hypothetical protein
MHRKKPIMPRAAWAEAKQSERGTAPAAEQEQDFFIEGEERESVSAFSKYEKPKQALEAAADSKTAKDDDSASDSDDVCKRDSWMPQKKKTSALGVFSGSKPSQSVSFEVSENDETHDVPEMK